MKRRLPPDAMWPARQPAFEVEYRRLASGIRVRIVSAGPPYGPPVVLLHGWGGSAYRFRRNLPALGAAGYRAIAPDLKGHGLSDKPIAPLGCTLDAMTDHAIDILDALALPNTVLIGQSMGGRIALEVAARAPRRVARLVLIDPVGIGCVVPRALIRLGGSPLVPAVRPLLMRRRMIAAAMRAAYGAPERIDERDVDEYWAPTQFPAFLRTSQQLLRELTWDSLTPSELERLSVPTLVIRGTLDRVISTSRDDPLLARRPGFQVVWIEGAGHVPNEECAAETNDAILRFVRDEAP